ncbi:hypothetical protein RRG08_007901 [Elysia crispata]|uniref:Uncharacterized protein n=1 Tax=Elysia crispata TaxID=231223 RepID=A0AAE1CNJ5_9GAST|nr:hypothetical protein RRG08_007901 [Elysia crispata]
MHRGREILNSHRATVASGNGTTCLPGCYRRGHSLSRPHLAAKGGGKDYCPSHTRESSSYHRALSPRLLVCRGRGGSVTRHRPSPVTADTICPTDLVQESLEADSPGAAGAYCYSNGSISITRYQPDSN